MNEREVCLALDYGSCQPWTFGFGYGTKRKSNEIYIYELLTACTHVKTFHITFNCRYI